MSNTQAVSMISALLGGMKISPVTLEWANDVPVAQVTMNAVAEQLDNIGSVAGGALNKMSLSAAIKYIALEDQELEILKGTSGNPVRSSPAFAGYKPPSELQRDIDHVHLETLYFEEEAEQLRRRTQQITATSRSMSHNFRLLQDTHTTVRSMNDDVAKRLNEFSMQMEGIIADSTQASYALLSSFELLNFHSYTSSFENMNATYSSYVRSLTSYLDAVDSSAAVSLTETTSNTEELEGILRRYGPDVKLEDMSPTVQDFYKREAYVNQLNNLCDRMDDVSTDAIAKATIRFADSTSANEACIIPDARIELEAAVEMDQLAYINTRGNFIGQATAVMHDSTMSRLESLLRSLSLEEKLVQEAEVLCGVLKEEVKCVASSSSFSEIQLPSERQEVPKVVGAQSWERELEARLRPFGPGEDALSQSLNAVNAEDRSILDAIYVNSPLNTSPPFAYSFHFTSLLGEARNTATHLAEETERLTKEVENNIASRRIQRKLGAFVDQFTA